MKRFMIISYSISGMGGGQMYQYNKLKYMKKSGYQTYIIYAIPGEIVIKDIYSVAEVKCIDVLNTHPLIVGKRIISKTIKDVETFLGSGISDIIIECNNKTASLWGEIFAEKLQGFSYSLILDEKIGTIDKQLLQFFKYKKERDELKGLKSETYEMIFEGEKVPSDYQYCFPIAGNNVVSDVMFEDIIDNNKTYNLKICSIGRLDKDYVQILVSEIISFAQENRNMTICMGFIGNSPKGIVETAIKEKVKSIVNLDVYLFGAMYPIPEKLLYKFDVFISSAGSARVSGNRGLLTITIDARDHMAIGVYEYETDNTVFRQNEPKTPISKKLKEVVENYDKIKSALYIKKAIDIDNTFSRHLEYYKMHINTKEYFNVLSMKLSIGKMVEKAIYNVFGKKIYEKIRKTFFLKIQR